MHDLRSSVNLVEQVESIKGDDVVCKIKNSATLAGSMFTLHVCQVRIEMPTLSEKDKEVSHTFKLCMVFCSSEKTVYTLLTLTGNI